MRLYDFYIRESGRENQYPQCHYAFLPIENDDNRWKYTERSIEGKFTAIKPTAFVSRCDKINKVAVVQYIDFNIASQTDEEVVIKSANIAYFTTPKEIASVGGVDRKRTREFYLRFVNQEMQQEDED